MFVIINLILLLLATTGSIIAVGGGTWENGKITYRGKMAILFLALALSVGAYKEFLVHNERLLSSQQQIASKNRQLQLMSNLSEVKDSVWKLLSTQELTVDEIRKGLSNINDRLGELGNLMVSTSKNGDQAETPTSPELDLPQGLQGERGLQGLQGERGSQGLQGGRGLQGLQGERGSQGLQGGRGLQGLQGEIGSQGLQGERGSQGIQGERGLTGGDNVPPSRPTGLRIIKEPKDETISREKVPKVD